MRPGLDYTVAHYGILTADPRLDCVLCFCDDRDGASWEAGEVGGFEAYLLADEEESAAAEVYRQVRAGVFVRGQGCLSEGRGVCLCLCECTGVSMKVKRCL